MVNKCDFYLPGLPAFTMLTDHRLLVGNQPHKLDNTHLMQEKLTNFSFDIKGVEAGTHMLANTLSCVPVFQPKRRKKKRKIQPYTAYRLCTKQN